ncbi:transcription elongation factor GreA [Desulfacinum hydrothermale DSM 13146]|uniref:Transcription elongation factor GreA n=1 Tax=Desulfacinum hydrothermale DSM 13146 TaxID=1121390 RepID=A0A1W1X8W5_9BACT|nr:transcription elongation factor GreA [Desulfacinum hydrothermale]SMC20376.1 transcription elongation factor GreA [Desulfacinum hydrothermale DSM 13146]
MDKVPITRNGYRHLAQKLMHLRRVVRPQVLEELQEARLYGVKADNQQYLLARENHSVLVRKIHDLETQLARCEIFVGRKFLSKVVGFGTWTVVRNVDTGETHRFQMVGPFESDVANGRLSIHSPVGRSLMGRTEGDEVTVFTPAGERNYQILEIQP